MVFKDFYIQQHRKKNVKVNITTVLTIYLIYSGPTLKQGSPLVAMCFTIEVLNYICQATFCLFMCLCFH